MTDMKQPEALRLAQFCRAIARGLLVKPYIEDLNAAAALLAHQHAEITELRTKLEELEKQEPVAVKNHHQHMHMVGPDDGGRIRIDELSAIPIGARLYVAAGARPVELAPAGEYPPLPEWSKMDNLGGLVPSEIRRELRAYIDADRAMRAAQPAPAAQDDAKDAARLYPVVIDGLLWLCTKRGGTFKPVDDCAAVNPPLSWKNALAADKREPT